MEPTTNKVTAGRTAISKNAHGSPVVKRLGTRDSCMPCPLGDVTPHGRHPDTSHLAGRLCGGGLTVHLGHGQLWTSPQSVVTGSQEGWLYDKWAAIALGNP